MDRLRRLDQVEDVQTRNGTVRLSSLNGPQTIGALMELARASGVVVRRVSVESTMLDDVFLHYTGRGLRDELGEGRSDIGHLYR